MKFVFKLLLLLLVAHRLIQSDIVWDDVRGRGHETEPASLLRPRFIAAVTARAQIVAAIWI